MSPPELCEVMAHVAAHGFGVPLVSYTPEWAEANGLPTVCDRCGLLFDRTMSTRHIPAALQAALRAEGRAAEAVNTHCPRFIGRDERWTCEGKALKP